MPKLEITLSKSNPEYNNIMKEYKRRYYIKKIRPKSYKQKPKEVINQSNILIFD